MWQNQRKDAQKRAVRPKQHTKEGVFAAALRVEGWTRNAWLGEPFPFFICMVDLCLWDYDEVTEAYFTAQKEVHSSKVS